MYILTYHILETHYKKSQILYFSFYNDQKHENNFHDKINIEMKM